MIDTNVRHRPFKRLSEFLDRNVTVEAAYISTAQFRRIPATVIACSAIDLRLRMECNPAKGDIVTIDLEFSNSQTVEVQGLVHWTEMHGSCHEVGVFMDEPNSCLLPRALVDKRRKEERYRCRQAGKLMLGPQQAEGDAVAVNYSYSGVAFRSTTCSEIDAEMSFRWIANPNTKTIRGKIRWQVQQASGVLIGAELTPGDALVLAGLK